MDSDITQTATFYRLWGWFETNKKQVAAGFAVVLAVGLVLWFIIWQRNEKETAAGEALSSVFASRAGGGAARPDAQAYLKIAAQYPNSQAGTRALLLAAGALFTEGKFSEAQAQFARFMREHHDSPFMGEALLGSAACLDAQGKTDAAITAYRDLIDHHPGENVIPQAKFALARLYEGQNKIDLAKNLYEEVAKGDPNSSLPSEAGMRFEELKLKYPAPSPALSAMPATNSVPARLSTNGPAPLANQKP